MRARASQDFFDRSEIYQSDTADEDANRVKVLLICVCTHSPRVYVLHPQTGALPRTQNFPMQVADNALGDQHRRYHFVLLHFTDTDSQALTYGASDAYNQVRLSSVHPPTIVPFATISCRLWLPLILAVCAGQHERIAHTTPRCSMG